MLLKGISDICTCKFLLRVDLLQFESSTDCCITLYVDSRFFKHAVDDSLVLRGVGLYDFELCTF